MKGWEDYFLWRNKWLLFDIILLNSQKFSNWPEFLFPMFVFSSAIQ